MRPVRALTLSASNSSPTVEFPGEVRPRIESRLGFRVGGKIVSRKVDVGATVKRGDVLMQLDTQDFKLAQARALASVRAAEANRDLAAADLKRYEELRGKGFVAQSALDAKAATLKVGQASVDAALAAWREQSNQSAYATLVSDTDGVITSIDAEVGQVVGPGIPVLRVARPGEKEVVIGIPEDMIDDLRRFTDVKVRLWALPNQVIPGRIREIASIADPGTRTYAVKVAVPARPEIQLGMSATVQFTYHDDAHRIRLPLSALVANRGDNAVWLIENGTVRLVPVRLGEMVGNEILVTAGLLPGQTVVAAGTNLLKNGQKVRILVGDVARRGDTEAALASGGVVK